MGFFLCLFFISTSHAQEPSLASAQAIYKNAQTKFLCLKENPSATCPTQKLSLPLQSQILECEATLKNNQCDDLVKKQPEYYGSLKKCRADQFCHDYLFQEIKSLNSCVNGINEGIGETINGVIQGSKKFGEPFQVATEVFKGMGNLAAKAKEDQKFYKRMCEGNLGCMRALVAGIPKFQAMSDEGLKKYSWDNLVSERNQFDYLLKTYERQTAKPKYHPERAESPTDNLQAISVIREWLHHKKIQMECLDAEAQWEMICWGASYFIEGGVVLKAASREAKYLARAEEAEGSGEGVAAKAEQRSAAARTLTDSELYGERLGLVDYPNLPPSLRIAKYRANDGREYLMLERPEKLQSGEIKISRRELPVDSKTGAINSRTPVGKELMTAIVQQSGGKTTAVFFDLNNLKYINENFAKGFKAGDTFVQDFAKLVNEATGGKGQLFRNGGDEFVLIIHENDPAKVKAILNRIFQDVNKGPLAKMFRDEAASIRQAHAASNDPSNTLGLENSLRYTQPGVSAGAVVASPYESIDSILYRAEQQAQAAKVITKEQLNIDASKYGGKAHDPNTKPNFDYVPQAENPLPPTPTETSLPEVHSFSDAKKFMSESSNPHLYRFNDMKIVVSENEKGQKILRQETYARDSAGNLRTTSREIIVNQLTGAIDASTEHGKEIIDHMIRSSNPAQPKSFVEVSIENFGPFNYFKNKSATGDEVMKAIARVVQKRMATSDLPFQKGPNILFSTESSSTKALQLNIQRDLLYDPTIRKIVAEEKAHLRDQIVQSQDNPTKRQEFEKALKDLERRAEQFPVTATQIHDGDDLGRILQRLQP